MLLAQQSSETCASVGKPSAKCVGGTIGLLGGVALRATLQIDKRDCRTLFWGQSDNGGSDDIRSIWLTRCGLREVIGRKLAEGPGAGILAPGFAGCVSRDAEEPRSELDRA